MPNNNTANSRVEILDLKGRIKEENGKWYEHHKEMGSIGYQYLKEF
jgi:hypothetical protein